MFFKRSNGEFRETDRVTRFKLIKSGKNWLRASTSNFGLLKVIRGQVEETIVAEVREDAGMTGRSFLKGAAVAVAVLSLASFVNTSYADELGKDEVTTSAVVNTPAVASEPAALNEQDSKEVVETLNESATETPASTAPASTAPSSEVVETVPASDDKTILEQNASEAALLNKIAEKYASNHQNTEQKEAINDAVAKVQSELTAGDKLTDTDATAQTYADQRERLSKSVDDMMATLTAAGFEGNTTVNGAPAISAQLDAIATSNTLSAGVSVTPGMDDANGATLTDKATSIPAGYTADPGANRMTFGIWNLKSYNQEYNANYYVTLSVDKTQSSNNPDVYVRLIDKNTGNEVANTTLNSALSGKEVNLGNLSTNKYYPYFVYNKSNDGGSATVDAIIKNNEDILFAKTIAQVYDYLTPANQGETKPNVQIGVPSTKMDQTTRYKVVDTASSTYDANRSSADTSTQSYKPTGNETELASYTQTGIQGQNYTASNPRSFEGYVLYQQADASTTSGELGNSVGTKYAELKGTRAHYYVKRIREVVANDGSTVTKYYVLDPSSVSTFNESTMANNTDTTGYTLVYTTPLIKPGEKYIPSATNMDAGKTLVSSKNGDYELSVSPWHNPDKPDEGLVYITGWYAKGHHSDATYMFVDEPKGTANSVTGGNTQNVIGGRTKYALQADGKTIQTDSTGKPVKTIGGFGNQFSIPSANEKPSGEAVHYYRKSDVKGNVFVHYKDTEGTTIQNSVTDEDQQPINKHYETQDNRPQTIKKDGKTYELVPAGNYKVGEVDEEGHLKSSDPTTGEVAKEDKNVTYIYKLKEEPKGNVYVHYVDTEGKQIKSDVTDEDQQPVDKDYDTVVDNRPKEIEKDGKTYELVPAGTYKVGEVDDQGHLKSTDPTTGKVIEGDKNVTYVYKLKEGEVVITYVDVNGKEIQKPRQDTPNSPYDTPYNTTKEDKKPNFIKAEDGKTYKIVPKGDYPVGKVDENGHLEKSDPVTGKVTKPKSTITYVYKEVNGNVYVHYKDTEGNELKASVTDMDKEPVDSAYDTVTDNRPKEIEKDGKTYVLVPAGTYKVGEVDEQSHLKSTDPTTGKVAEQDKNVTYIYKLKEEPVQPKGSVFVHYKDTEGNELKTSVTDMDKEPVDSAYDTVVDNRPKEIEKDGKTYVLVPAGTYKVGEVDEQGHLKSTDPTTGKVAEQDKNVTYIYKLKEEPVQPKGSVFVHYKDTEGNELKASVTDMDKEPVDSDYDTVVDNRPKEIEKDGKTYVLVPAGTYKVGEVDEQSHLKSTDPTTGKVAEQDKNVTYIYKLKEEPVQPKGSVFVHYKDTEGNELKTSVTDMDKEPVDSAYDTVVDNRPKEIEKDGKTYVLVPAGTYKVGEVDEQGHLKSTDPTTGKVAEQDKNVTYIYKLKEEPVQPKGSVFVHYKDTEGNELKTSVTDMDKEPVDSDYDTVVDNRPKEIEKDGKTYVLVPAGTYKVGEVDEQGHLKSTDPTTGKVAEQDKNVTYIYKLKEEPVQPKGSVFVHYKDTEGNELKTSVTDMDKEPVDSAYDTVVDNRPKEIEKDGKTYVLVPAGTYKVGEVDEQGHLKSTDPTTGKVAEQDKNVTYIYKLKEEPVQPKGSVFVHYKDTEGNELKTSVTDMDKEPVDSDYDTVVDNRPKEIEKDGKTYVLVPAGTYKVGEVDEQGHLKSTDPTTGKVAEQDKNVTYIYKLKEEPVQPKGSVFVHYKDTEGNELKTSVTDMDKEPVDSDYDTVVDNRPKEIEKDGKTYVLVPAGTYKVGEVDEQGHLKSTDPTTGKVAEQDKNVTYIYKLKEEPVQPKGSVFVHYKDTEGNELKASVTDMDKEPVDSDYDTVVDNRPKEIEKDGKTYVLVPAGTYKVGEVDEQSHLKSTDPTTGKVAEQDKNVTYIYKLKEEPVQPKGSVFVHYKDTEGNELKTSVTDMDKEPVDSAYDTVVDNRPKEIEKDGKTYVLVPAGTYKVGEVDEQGHLKSTDPTTGKVAEQDKNVTYIYKLKEEPVQPKGSVFVHYKDTEGNELKTSVTDMDKEPVDSDYDTVVDNRPKEIEKDGKTYVLVPAGTYKVGEVDEQGHLKSTDPTTGKVAEQDKNVTYIYKLKEEPVQPKGSVFVHYKDTEGNELKTSVTDMDKEPVDSAYDTVVDNRPKEIEKDGKTYVLVPAGTYKVGEVDEQGHLKSTDPTTGKVAEQDKNVTYIYKLKEEPVQPKGSVFVHYKDTEGNELKTSVTDMDKEPVDSDYDTVVDNRPKEIEKDGKTYVLVPAGTYKVGEVDEQGHLKSTDPTTGKVAEQDKNVTYIYKLKETPDKPVEPTPDKPVEPTPDKPVEPTPDKPVEPTPDKPVEPTPDKPVEPTPDKPVEPTPDKPVEPTPDKPVEPTPDKPVEPTPDKPVEPTPDKPVEPTPDKPVEPTPDKPVEPTPDKPVEPTPDKPVEPTPDKPVEPTPDKPVEPTPDKPVEPTPDKPVEPTPDKPVEPTPDKPVEPTPDKPVEPTPDKPVEPTPDKPVEPTPDKPVEPTPDKPVEPTPDKPVEPTPDKPVEPTPDKPVDPTPDKPVEPTPDKPVEPTPDKPVDPTPGKPVNPTPGKPVDPTPGKPVNPTPGKPVNPTPGKPVNPTPGKPVDPTPGKPVNPTPGKPVDPTPGKPVNPTPGKPVDPTPGKPVDPTPGKPVNPTPGKPVNPTPGKPVDPTPGKPVNPTPSKPVSEQPANPTSAKAQLPNTGETTSAGSTVLGVVAGLVGLAALGRRKKEDEK